MSTPGDSLNYDRHDGFDRIKTVNVPPLPADIVEGLKPYELAALAFNIAEFELIDETALAGHKEPRLFFMHRPQSEQMSQVYAVRSPDDKSPERLTYFNTGGGRTITNWTPVLGDNLHGKYRKGGAIFSMDLNGDEVFQLWRYWEDDAQEVPFGPVAGELDNKPGRGRIERLTNDGFKYLRPLISKQGRGNLLVFGSNLENNKDTKIYSVDLSKSGWNPVKIFDNPAGISYPASFSANEQYLIVNRSISNSNIPHYVVDLHNVTAEAKQILLPGIDPTMPVAIRSAQFLRRSGSTNIIFDTDADGDFTSVILYDLTTNSVQHLTNPDPSLRAICPIPWNVALQALTADYALFTANRDGYCDLYRYDMALNEMKPIMLPGQGENILKDIITDEANGRPNTILASITSPHLASSISELALSSSNTLVLKPYVACQTHKPDYPTSSPALIRYKSFDGLSIPAWVYKPTETSEKGKLPCVIYIHGGPTAQVRPSFRVSLNAYILNEMGTALIMPNVRGSGGYGKAYQKADDVFKREDSVKDIGALIEYISSSMPEIDTSRIAVMGGSYGGYMTFACLVHYSSLIRCGVASCGIANWVTFLESTHPSRRAHRRNEYGDESDPNVRKFLESIAPLNHVDDINVPLYISQGEQDTRVPLSEALLMFNKVRAKGLDTWLVVGEQEGHGMADQDRLEFQRHSGYDNVKTVNVPALPRDIVEGLKPYEAAALGFRLCGTEKLTESASGLDAIRFYYQHRPPGERLPQIYSVTGPSDRYPERLTYFNVGSGRVFDA
ncbi:alpha/beta-hydrolase [Dacryopinax primogenitus]|uniref:Prolyl endopeptidase n=1 Tax=Dacryopinax primogenitus (strain DJM 731) TaxID=1858805 RepID=M5GCY2_DACPD|nr:alpha/beta-hydrolase [Dacryopinax primogenitus]EJU04122.1 alpha/beta-hydrolase [Dacryopinax primogenitus]